MRLLGAVVVEQPFQVVGEVDGVERSIIVIGLAVATGIPRDYGKVLGEGGELVVPVGAVAADTVHEDEQRARALLIHGEAGCAGDILSSPGCRRGCSSHAHLRLLSSRPIIVGLLLLSLLSAQSVEGSRNSLA